MTKTRVRVAWMTIIVGLMTVNTYAQTNTFPSSGNVGIGTTNPSQSLEVNGNSAIDGQYIYLNSSGGSGGVNSANTGPLIYTDINSTVIKSGPGWGNFVLQNYAGNNFALFNPNGNSFIAGGVGIGTTGPASVLEVSQSAASTVYPLYITNGNSSTNSGQNSGLVFTGFDHIGGHKMMASIQGIPLGYDINSGMLSFSTSGGNIYSPSGLTERMRIDNNGNVGIGTTSPAQTLEVNGATQVDQAFYANGGIVFPNGGGTQTTAWTGVLCGGDYAEDMRAAKKKQVYEPGDVLVLTSDDDSDVHKSTEPYSTMVAGIYATKPGVVGLRDAVAKSADNVPMAMVGVVPTKVTAENGPIRKGDLLVTSSQEGYAMKGTDRSKMLGAVLGKAMGSLDSGTGTIEVLVTLQ